MEAHMNDGYGVVLLTNGRPSEELARWVVDVVKAAMRNKPLPDAPIARPSAPAPAATAPDPVVPPEFRAFVGRYKNNNPEDTVLEIFVRNGRLTAARHLSDKGDMLIRLGPGLFKPASPDFNPERYRFDTIVDGVALRMMSSGMPMYRVMRD